MLEIINALAQIYLCFDLVADDVEHLEVEQETDSGAGPCSKPAIQFSVISVIYHIPPKINLKQIKVRHEQSFRITHFW